MQTRLYLNTCNPVDVVKTQHMKISELQMVLNDGVKATYDDKEKETHIPLYPHSDTIYTSCYR